jgi:ribosomal protein L40E
VRATPTVTLANQIRAELFPKCDAILEQCRQHLQTRVNAIARVPLQEPGLISTALQGAATGQLAAGLGRHGKTLGTVGAVLAVGEQWSRKTALLATQLEAAEQAQASARDKISEYLGAMIPGLCQDLFDYGCAKCLGAEIDFKSQEAALDKFGDFIRDHQAKLDHALKVDADRREEARNRALKAEEVKAVEQKKKSEQSDKAASKGCGGCLVAAGGLLTIAFVSMILDTTSTASGESLGLGFAIGVSLFVFGIFVLLMNRKPRQRAVETKAEALPATGTERGRLLQTEFPAQTKVCAYCGRENPLDAAQCRECGTTDFKPVLWRPMRTTLLLSTCTVPFAFVNLPIMNPPLTHHVPATFPLTKLPSALCSILLDRLASSVQVPISFWRISESVGLLLQPVSNMLNAITGHANLTKVCGTPNAPDQRPRATDPRH